MVKRLVVVQKIAGSSPVSHPHEHIAQLQKEDGMAKIKVGSVLHGFCGGEFGRDSYDCKRVEAVGSDWMVVRTTSGQPDFYVGKTKKLKEHLVVQEEGSCSCF